MPQHTASLRLAVRGEPWDEGIEAYMTKTVEICTMNANLHSDTGYYYKYKRVLWGLPAILIPIVMSPISLMVGWSKGDTCANITASDYINACGFLITGVLSGVYSFFDYGTKMQVHFQHAGLYDLIKSDIETEMVKHRPYRIHADVFMTRVKMLMDQAAQTEPIIPQGILKRNKMTKEMVREKKTELVRIELTPGNSDASEESESKRIQVDA
jgi:hypothetical protein